MTTTKISAINTKVGQVVTKFTISLITLTLMGVCTVYAAAQDIHSHAVSSQEQSQEQSSQAGALLRVVRESTERFKDVKVAEHAGYRLEFGCVSGPDYGAMGLHYVNDTLVGDGVLDATRPQIILYEALSNGTVQLTGADYLVLADAWNAAHNGVPPQLMGQIFQYFDTPNRFGLPAFYTLHVWAWKQNPSGAFVNWHPHVSCQSFVGQTTP